MAKSQVSGVQRGPFQKGRVLSRQLESSSPFLSLSRAGSFLGWEMDPAIQPPAWSSGVRQGLMCPPTLYFESLIDRRGFVQSDTVLPSPIRSDEPACRAKPDASMVGGHP